jgi:AcrR family transcriptional regulator
MTTTATVGLRERKKVKTRVLLQACALRLFQQQGYSVTTIEQIASTAEISLRTFFRYFPNKEDVVLYDALDSFLAATIQTAPQEMSTLQAIRVASKSVYGGLSPEQRALVQIRHELLVKVPELRMRLIAKLAEDVPSIADALAKRTGSPMDDLAVRTTSGAIIGVSIAALATVVEAQELDLDTYLQRIDEGLAQLEKGLVL